MTACSVDRDRRSRGVIVYVPGRIIQQLTLKRFGVDRGSRSTTFSGFGPGTWSY